MSLGEALRLSLFGTSHGPRVGAILEGVPAGITIDYNNLKLLMNERRPGGRYASKRKEPDHVEFLSGIDNGITTGEKIEISIKNKDVRTKDYSFLPDHPRPGHQDMVMMKKTDGEADLRGGGMSSARLTAPIVAASAIITPLIQQLGINVNAHVCGIGIVDSKPIAECEPKWATDECKDIRCQDKKSRIGNDKNR